MIEVEEAVRLVLDRCQQLDPVELAVVDALGCALAEEVRSDVDSPPHDKSLVDGFAVRLSDAVPGTELEVLEEVTAGGVPTYPLQPGKTSHVMTGAPIPEGTEAMIMVEQVDHINQARVRLKADGVERSQFIMRRATAFAQNEVVISAGAVVRPLEVGLLCEVGRNRIRCVPPPRVSVLPTGDELVECVKKPGPGQIRNSNGPMLHSAAAREGAHVAVLEVGRDESQQLRSQIQHGLSSDILVLSGGVSAGTRDLVPPTLATLGVQEVFHKVRVKPGKPIWFGLWEDTERRCLVFGLPGNPVSSLVCFYLFVRPAIRALAGIDPTVALRRAALATSFQHRGGRPTYYPGCCVQTADGAEVTPLPWHGSSDLRGLVRANCLICFPAGDRNYSAGEHIDALDL